MNIRSLTNRNLKNNHINFVNSLNYSNPSSSQSSSSNELYFPESELKIRAQKEQLKILKDKLNDKIDFIEELKKAAELALANGDMKLYGQIMEKLNLLHKEVFMINKQMVSTIKEILELQLKIESQKNKYQASNIEQDSSAQAITNE